MGSHQSEQCDHVWEGVLRTDYNVNVQDFPDSVCGHCYRPHHVSNRKLGLVRERMLRDWYQIQRNPIWAQHRVLSKHYVSRLHLVPEQKELLDYGVRFYHWSLDRSNTPQNNLCKKLICSINNSRQAATIIIDLGDCVTDYCIDVDQAIANASR